MKIIYIVMIFFKNNDLISEMVENGRVDLEQGQVKLYCSCLVFDKMPK